MHQVTQCHARLHFAFEANQDGLGHVQRHHACSRTESHQARTSREADTDWETCVRVATSTDGVRQQQTVQPRVNHTVAWTQSYATTVADERWQFAVRFHVHRLGVSRCVAERLHDHVSREAQASQVFQLVACHWACGVL